MSCLTRCAALGIASLVTACGASPSAPTGSTSTTKTEIFSGILERGGSRFYSFSTSSGGEVLVTVASLTSGSLVRTALSAAVEVGVGTPAGTDCAVASSAEVRAGLSAQLTLERWAGTHCVRVHDIGELEGAVTFAIRIVHL